MLFAWKHRKIRYLAVALVLASAVCLNYMLTVQAIETPQFGDYARYECTTTDSSRSELEQLSVFTLSSLNAVPLANALCADDHVAEQYAGVAIEWRPRGYLTAQNIVEQKYDLLLNRKYHMLGLVPEFFDYYGHLLDSSPYSVYWIAHDKGLRLSQSYYSGKSVGLLDDFYSQSFYLLPMNSLAKANISLKDSQKRYYANINALFSAFENREVDIITIPDIKALNPGSTTRSVSKLLIEEQASPATWYVKTTENNTHTSCHLLEALSHAIDNQLYGSGSSEAPGERCQ